VVHRVQVNGADLEVTVVGTGEPMLFVQTALSADELVPIASETVLAADFRRIIYHRRGYGGSSAPVGPSSIAADAADAVALLDILGLDRVHLVGLSFSAAIALQLASTVPERVHSLTVIEPPPVHVPSAAQFRAANAHLVELRRDAGVPAALDAFLTMLVGPHWRRELDERRPGSVAQLETDASTFFDAEIPALLDWRFSGRDAAQITAPVLYVGGTDSGPLFAEVRTQMLGWMPDAEDILVAGADHSVAVTHPREVATALASFAHRHPITAATPP
jgi:pimeloyl-ACP methyl ester carboxylesterase